MAQGIRKIRADSHTKWMHHEVTRKLYRPYPWVLIFFFLQWYPWAGIFCFSQWFTAAAAAANVCAWSVLLYTNTFFVSKSSLEGKNQPMSLNIEPGMDDIGLGWVEFISGVGETKAKVYCKITQSKKGSSIKYFWWVRLGIIFFFWIRGDEIVVPLVKRLICL